MKIAIIDKKYQNACRLLDDNGYTHLNSESELCNSDISNVEIICGNPDKHNLLKYKNLKLLLLPSHGYNDYDSSKYYISQTMVATCNGIYSVPIAEYVICCMMLMGKRSICNYVGVPFFKFLFRSLEIDNSQDKELEKCSVAIYGCGSIGNEISIKLKNLGCKKIYGVKRNSKAVYGGEYTEILPLEKAEGILNKMDYVISVMPENQDSIGYFNENRFNAMNKNTIFINVGRGSAVVFRDLLKCLKRKRISGAVLDVTDPEPISYCSLARRTRRLLITNHSSFFSNENDARIDSMFCSQLNLFFNDKNLYHSIKINLKDNEYD